MQLYVLVNKENKLVKMVGGGGDTIVISPTCQTYETIFCTDDKYLVDNLLTNDTFKHYGITWTWDYPYSECTFIELGVDNDNSRDKRKETVR
jgi:signal peptidase I